MDIKKLENKCLKPILYSVYGNELCGDTLQDLLSNMVAYINETIKQTNDNTILVNNLYDWIKKQGLKEEVIKQLNILIDNGTFEQLINDELFSDLSEKIELNTQSIAKEISDRETSISEERTTRIKQITDIRNYIDNRPKSIKDFLTGRTDTEALIEAGKSGATVTIDINRPMSVNGVIPLHENTSFIGDNFTFNIVGNYGGFKFSRNNTFSGFNIKMLGDCYRGTLFELSTETIVKYGKSIGENLANVFIRDIEITNNYDKSMRNLGEILLLKATEESYEQDPSIKQLGFWNFVMENVTLRGYITTFCRNFSNRTVNKDTWITDCTFRNIKCFSCEYMFLGTESITTMDNPNYYDIENCLFENISLQCDHSNLMFYFTATHKTLIKCMPWDWQYSQKVNGRSTRPYQLLQREIDEHKIIIDEVYNEPVNVFDVRGLEDDYSRTYDYISKVVQFKMSLKGETMPQVFPLYEQPANSVWKLCSYKLDNNNGACKFKIVLPQLEYVGVGYGSYTITIADGVVRLFSETNDSDNSRLISFSYEIKEGIFTLYVKFTQAVSNKIVIESQPLLTSTGNKFYFNSYPENKGVVDQPGALLSSLPNIPVKVVSDINSVNTIANLKEGTMVFDTSQSKLYIKINGWNTEWKSIQLS